MVTATLDGQNMILYINGREVSKQPQTVTIQDLGIDLFRMGSLSADSPNLNATLYLTSTWPRALSQREVLNMFLETAQATSFAPFNTHFYNPIRTNHNLGDPWVIFHAGVYYYCGGSINLFASPTLSGILAYNSVTRKNVFQAAQHGLTEVWAPELHRFNDTWYIFFTATLANEPPAPNRRMYVLRNRNASPLMGNWEFMGKLHLPEDQWAIDGTTFEHNGRFFHIWSGWRDPSDGPGVWRQHLYIAELDPNDISKVKSGTQRVMIAAPEFEWETRGLPQLEGPAMIKSPSGTVYCIYSASFSRSNFYALGALRLTGNDPMNASHWLKHPEPLFESDPDNDVYSPGHCSITMSPDGREYWVVYHTAKARNSGWDRNARVQRLEWRNDRPFMGKPDPLWVPQPLPSGEKADRIIFQAEDMIFSGGDPKIIDIPGGRGKAVSLEPLRDMITIVVDIVQDGRYAVNVRHSTPYDVLKYIQLIVNGDSLNSIIANRSGAAGSFSMDVVVVPLRKGTNTLTFSVSSSDVNLEIDSVILEKMLPFRYIN